MLDKDRAYYQAMFITNPELNDQSLKTWLQIISIRSFKQPFRHEAKVNHRLKTTGGRYHLTTHHIDVNPRVYELYGWEELVDVLLHELCHYHLHLSGQGYQHKDRDFKEWLKAVGGSRYVKPLATKNASYHYQCQKCYADFYRQKKVALQRYRCQCGGSLKEII